MARVNKVDFYCGAFLAYLITNGVEPTLFDAAENSKIIGFSQGTTDFNAYLKYVTTSKTSILRGKQYTRWDVVFSEAEKNYLYEAFAEEGKENIVVLVCANEDFKDTYFAVLSLEQAKECIGFDDVNKQVRISLRHLKGSKYVECYGTALVDTDAFKIKYNFDDYFGFGN